MAENKDDKPKLLTLKEAADRISIHVDTARRLAREGKLPGAHKVGGQYRVNCKRLDAALGAD